MLKSTIEVSNLPKNNSSSIAMNFEEWMFSSVGLHDKLAFFELLSVDDRLIFFEHDPISGKVHFSDAFYSTTGYEQGSITNLEQFLKVVISNHSLDERHRDFAASGEMSMDYEFQLVKKDGSMMWGTGYCKKVWMPQAERNLLIGFMYNVTEQKLVEIELQEKTSLYDMVFTGKNDAIFHHDPFKDEIHYSDSFYDMLGYEVGSITTFEAFSNIVIGKDYETVKNELDEYMASDEMYTFFENQFLKSDGTPLWVLSRTKRIWNPGASNYILIGMITDITDRKEAEAEIRQLAYFDTVTGIPNRTYFNEQLDEIIESDLNGYLLFLDLDDFKRINDIYGHIYGDLILKAFSERLKEVLPVSAFIGRLSGDEFAAIIPAESFEEIDEITDRLIESFRLPYEVGGKSIFATSSVGIVDLKIENSDNTSLLICADIAMYEAKNKGKNQKEFYCKNFLYNLQREADIEIALRTAISDHELYCVFQPIFNAKTMEISSFESLLRFRSGKLGLVSPGEFIPVAERTGQIVEIGLYGIYESAKKVIEWHRKGYKFKRANFNVSYVGITSENFLIGLEHLTKDLGMPHNMITVELTESGLLEFQEDIRERMNSVIELGVNFSLDDFGTGFSSFRYLSESVFSSIKIDLSYIQRITISEQDEKLVRNLIQLAHVLGMKVVAEGVETKEQFDLLLDMDVDYVQGYYLSKPLTAEQAEELLKSKM